MSDRTNKWGLLHGLAKHIRQAIIDEWELLLIDKTLKEEMYQRYLGEHAGFFFSDTARRPIAISKLQLGSDFVTDFVVPYDNRSVGWSYEFIEIESPHSPPFTQAEKPSARLVSALNQIVSWKAWIAKHTNEIEQLLGNSINLQDSITFTVYIGTRENTIKSLAMRNQWANENRVYIRSFNSLTEKVAERHCADFFDDFSNELHELTPSTLNQLANPFFSSYSDREWRRIIHDGRFQAGGHMVAHNASLLLDSRKYSKKYSEFLTCEAKSMANQ